MSGKSHQQVGKTGTEVSLGSGMWRTGPAREHWLRHDFYIRFLCLLKIFTPYLSLLCGPFLRPCCPTSSCALLWVSTGFISPISWLCPYWRCHLLRGHAGQCVEVCPWPQEPSRCPESEMKSSQTQNKTTNDSIMKSHLEPLTHHGQVPVPLPPPSQRTLRLLCVASVYLTWVLPCWQWGISLIIYVSCFLIILNKMWSLSSHFIFSKHKRER